MTLRLVDSTAARVALLRSAYSRGTGFRERERILGLFGGVVVLARRVSIVPRCGPCLPFYSFQG
jgi:hypothetical protein